MIDRYENLPTRAAMRPRKNRRMRRASREA
jgi:hypothetical protein